MRAAWGVFVFFFQAEDGIRDGRVTGVQTCALPISAPGTSRRWVAVAAGQAVGAAPPEGAVAPEGAAPDGAPCAEGAAPAAGMAPDLRAEAIAAVRLIATAPSPASIATRITNGPSNGI